MNKWLKLSLLALFSLFLARSAPAQGFFTGNAWRYTPAGIFAASGASVQVCTVAGAGTPCTPTISLFKDAALSQPVANPLPVCSGTPPQFGCIDGLGNFSFYASTTGPYTYTITGAGLTAYGPIPISATNANIGLGSNNAFTGINTITDLNGGKYVDGSKYATLAAAFAACPSTGCVIDMRGNPSVLALGTFDPGATIPVTLLLGPYAGYTAVQFTLRRGFHMEGASSGATTITSVGSNATPLFVIPQTNSYAAQEMYIRGISFVGASGNTSQDGLFADSSTLTNAGLWYSIFEDLQFTGFKGSGIHLKGNINNSGSGHQFLQFRNCLVFGPAGRTNSLRIEGGVNQTDFYGGQFDGSGLGDGGTNIYVGTSGGGTQQPLTINFYGVTTQAASVGVNINGVNQLGFTGTHMEALLGGFNVTATSAPSSGVTIEHGYFAGTVGVNAGSGYDLNVGTALARVAFKNNLVGGAPDKVIAGTNFNTISIQDTTYTNTAPYPSTTSGVTEQQNPAASLDTAGDHTVLLNASATAISTINSMLGVGESITFRANAGSGVTFVTGGNLNLGAGGSPLTLQTNDTATFVRQDLVNEWMLVGWTGARSEFAVTQGTAPATATGLSVCYADSAANVLECSNNAGPFKPVTQTIASGTFTLGTGAISSNTCATTVTVVGANIATSDVVSWSFNSDPNAVTGYGAGATGTLSIWTFPTSGNANVRVCNLTAGSITPGAATLNWRVVR